MVPAVSRSLPGHVDDRTVSLLKEERNDCLSREEDRLCANNVSLMNLFNVADLDPPLETYLDVQVEDLLVLGDGGLVGGLRGACQYIILF
jgi:hypothetical protein